MKLTFDDVLIEPQFSSIRSRKDVDLSSEVVPGLKLQLPIISTNMASITEVKMANEMKRNGAIGALHRFADPIQRINMFNESPQDTFVSIGVGKTEQEICEYLYNNGARNFIIDVAHGAQISVLEQYVWLRNKFKDVKIVVGNFASLSSVDAFHIEAVRLTGSKPDAIKVGIGPGSVCTTRIKTGVGVPQLSAIMEISKHYNVIADGGMKSPGDIAKALAAGAKAVMIGRMLAGTNESAAYVNHLDNKSIYPQSQHLINEKISYDGSASNGYADGWRTSEGVQRYVNPKGPVEKILKDIEGGLRSSFTYVGAKNLKEFQKKAKFVEVSSNTLIENKAHIND